MPLYEPPASTANWNTMTAGPLSFFGKSPAVNQPGPYTAGYGGTNRSVGNYTPAAKTTPYATLVVALLNAAAATDLNDLRTGYENLRTFTEAMAQQHNALVADLKALGLVG